MPDVVPQTVGDVGDVGDVGEVGGVGGTDDISPETRSPLQQCELGLQRARSLISHAADLSSEVAPDVLRAAIVLAVAALDGYVRRKFFEKIADTLISTGDTTEFDNWVCRSLDKSALLACIKTHDRIDALLRAIESKLDEISYQGSQKIEKTFALFGIKDLFERAALNMGVTRDVLWKALDEHTQRRHDIAHQADIDWQQIPPKERPIRHEHAEGCIDIIGRFAQALEETLKR